MLAAHEPQRSLDARAQLALGEGLLEVVDGAEIEAADLHRVVAVAGHEDDRDVARRGVGAEPLERLEPVEPRHEEVHQHDVGVLRAREVDRLLAVRGEEDLVLGLEHLGEHLARVGLVVDHEQPRPRAGRARCRRRAGRASGAARTVRSRSSATRRSRDDLPAARLALAASAASEIRRGAELGRRGGEQRVAPVRRLAQPPVRVGDIREAARERLPEPPRALLRGERRRPRRSPRAAARAGRARSPRAAAGLGSCGVAAGIRPFGSSKSSGGGAERQAMPLRRESGRRPRPPARARPIGAASRACRHQ